MALLFDGNQGEMNELTPDQKAQLQRARDRAITLKHSSDHARVTGLQVLEPFLREASVACQAGADFQEAAFRADALQQPTKTNVPQPDTRPYNVDKGKEADALADALTRKMRKP